jgi:hypothetical protein
MSSSPNSDEIRVQARQVGQLSKPFEWANETTRRAFDLLTSEEQWAWTSETLDYERSDLLRAQTLAVNLRRLLEAQGGPCLVTDFAMMAMRHVDWGQLVEQLILYRFKLSRQGK